ncbi:hypothetical protein AAMO2058_001379900 [Amorphochlora amoebiformis]|uniref:Transmembrane protein n=1 Tax=Amorphochlora amoebiformis TaxID=1561963 RepID=A0A6T6YI77_9EUKA|mmetsp:Transcript_6315/g.9699  ORF Transcript_6315/g.9699 Transcript_6315/m.9699 type:complete len:218 (+) Transcript_6315:17-670(+)
MHRHGRVFFVRKRSKYAVMVGIIMAAMGLMVRFRKTGGLEGGAVQTRRTGDTTIGHGGLVVLRLRGGGKVKSHSQHNMRKKLNRGGYRTDPEARGNEKRGRRYIDIESHECRVEHKNNRFSRRRNTEFMEHIEQVLESNAVDQDKKSKRTTAKRMRKNSKHAKIEYLFSDDEPEEDRVSDRELLIRAADQMMEEALTQDEQDSEEDTERQMETEATA